MILLLYGCDLLEVLLEYDCCRCIQSLHCTLKNPCWLVIETCEDNAVVIREWTSQE